MISFVHRACAGIQRVARLLDRHGRLSYSQEGEDVLLARIFENQPCGFYVDVGACHPRRFSNTALFYTRGWRGINIEPNPDAIRGFHRLRRRDVNLQVGISDISGVKTYFMFDEPALNSFDHELTARRQRETTYRVVRTLEVKTERLDAILARYLPGAVDIDFLTVDAEGHDLQVIASNDWARYRPRYVLVERGGCTVMDALGTELNRLLCGEGYDLFAKTLNTLFYYDARNHARTFG